MICVRTLDSSKLSTESTASTSVTLTNTKLISVKVQSGAVQWGEGSWVRVELSGSRGQALFIAVTVHSEAAVAAAPVVAVRGKTVQEMRKCQLV